MQLPLRLCNCRVKTIVTDPHGFNAVAGKPVLVGQITARPVKPS